MKKNYFLSFAMLLCFLAFGFNAKAQVEGMADLFGKYQFTATFEFTEAGNAHSAMFKNDCEVVITKDDSGVGYAGVIKGLLGATYDQSIASIDVANNKFIVRNPNPNYGLWDGYIGVTDNTLENIQLYEMVYNYDPSTKEITIADFQIAAFSWPAPDYNMAAEVYVNVKNAKLTLIEAENIEIPSIAGDWDYAPVDGYVYNDSTFAKTFTMLLAATDDTNKAYSATITFGDYEPFTLPATFDGAMLTIPFDSLYLDVENKYRFGVASPGDERTGAFTFQYQSETSLMQYDRIYVRQDSVLKETERVDEETGEVVIDSVYGNPIIQRLNWGYATRESEATKGFTWAGTYNVSSEKIVANEELAAQFGEWPTEFNIVIEEKMPGSFYVTEIAGFDVYSPNQGNTIIKSADDNKSATIDLAQYYGMFLLQSLGNGEYLQIFDGNAATGTITLTLNEDGTITISPMFIQKTAWGADPSTFQPVIFYQNITAVKEVKKFEWFDTFTLTADVESLNGVEYPATFLVRFGDAEVYGTTYNSMVAEFFGYDNLTSNNYGGNALTVAEDTQSATMPAGIYAGGKYPNYFKIYDINGATTALNFVVNEDGTISMDDFIITTYDNNPDDWAAPAVEANAAKYTNVVLTRGDTTAVDSIVEEVAPAVEGIFDLMGRKYDAITAPGIYIVNGKKVVK